MSICKATSVPKLYRLWRQIRGNGMKDRVSLRVFEGHLYSLMDDDEFYEGSGCRKLINALTYQWDGMRLFAIQDEKNLDWGGSTQIKRTPEEQTKMNRLISSFDEMMRELKGRRVV